jgi:peptide subunit release factor RF-3
MSISEAQLKEQIDKRRTFAIISHPDAAQPFNA